MLSAHKIKLFVLGNVIKRCLQNIILEDKHTRYWHKYIRKPYSSLKHMKKTTLHQYHHEITVVHMNKKLTEIFVDLNTQTIYF
jgi:hypothetical protein